MAGTLGMLSTPLGSWVDDLFFNLYEQADDEQSIKTFENFVSPKFVLRSNRKCLNYEELRETTRQTREYYTLQTQSSKVCECWDDPESQGAGCVAQAGMFTMFNKSDGEKTKCSTLAIASVEVVEGRRMLVELTEAMNSSQQIKSL